MAHLNVNPADLLVAAEGFSDLAARAAEISPRLAAEVTRVIESHGPMGYPVAVGIVAGLVGPDARVAAKAEQFGQYAQRFAEHAATYVVEDGAAAGRIGDIAF